MRVNKKEIRSAVRQAFPGSEERARQSAEICAHVLGWERYRKAQVIGGYMPMPHEVDVTPILLDALRSGKTLALPRCSGTMNMTFHRVASLEETVVGAYGLLEPLPDAATISPDEIGLLLTPLEAIDRRGMRLGKGGGYYDRLLGKTEIFTLGMALEHQWIDQAPCDPWDRPLHAAAGKNGIILFGCCAEKNTPERNV